MTTLLSQSTLKSELWNQLPKFVREPNPNIYLESDNYVVLDFETTSFSHGDADDPANRLLLGCWLDSRTPDLGIRGGNVTSIQGGEYNLGKLRERLETVDFIVCHNSKFEFKWLHRAGYDIRRLLHYDTQIAEYCILGNRKRPLSLDATARRYNVGGKSSLVGSLIHNGYPVEEIPEEDLEAYCKNDVLVTHDLFLAQREILKKEGLLDVVYSRCLVTPALAGVEFRGSTLNGDAVRAKNTDIGLQFREASRRVDEITGGINFRSPKQLRAYLYDRLGFREVLDYKGNPVRTGTGEKSTGIKIIEQLKPETEEQKQFKEAIKAISPLKKRMQILEGMMECLKVDDGIIKAAFNQTVTQTHRLSSTGGKYGFQFHNFPRDLKALFSAREMGWYICESDASQLEFRVAVDLGDDARGRVDIREGLDIHKFSSKIIGVGRQDAKAFTFKPLYGGMSGSPGQRRYFREFQERYKGIYGTQSGWAYTVLRDKSLTTPTGLKFYWPDTELTRSGYIINRTSIFNYPIQMFATADMVPLIFVMIWHLTKDLKVHLINEVHDSVVAEVAPDDVDRYREIVKWAFGEGIISLLYTMFDYSFNTPLAVTVKFGKCWGEGPEEKYEYDPEGNKND